MASSCALSFIVRSPLPVLPASHCAGNIRILCPFIAAAQQKQYLCSSLGIVEAIAGTGVDPQFPDSIATEAVVTEVALFKPVKPFDDVYLSQRVTQVFQPFENGIFPLWREIVTNFVHTTFSFI